MIVGHRKIPVEVNGFPQGLLQLLYGSHLIENERMIPESRMLVSMNRALRIDLRGLLGEAVAIVRTEPGISREHLVTRLLEQLAGGGRCPRFIATLAREILRERCGGGA